MFLSRGDRDLGVAFQTHLVIPSKEIPGLMAFRMDWLDLLAVQGTLKSLLQHHSSKPSILWHSAFFMVQRSHPYNSRALEHRLNSCGVRA